MTTHPHGPMKIACPSCGADLDLPPYGKFLACAYCGTKSTLPSAPAPVAGAGPGGPKITLVVVPEGRRWAGDHRLYALIAMGLGVLVMVSVFAWLLSYTSDRRPSFERAHRERILALARQRSLHVGHHAGDDGRFVSARPLALDVDGNGVDDAVLLLRATQKQGGGLHVVALDGATLKERWRSAALRGGGATDMPRLFRDGGHVLANVVRTLVALRLVSGERRWGAEVPDRVERITRAGKAFSITAINGQQVTLRADTGAATADDSGDSDDDEPEPLAADGDLLPAHASTSSLLDLGPALWPGLRVHRAYCPAGRTERLRGGAARSAAERAPGATRAPGSTRARRGRYELRGGQIVRRSSRSVYRSSPSYRAHGSRYKATTYGCDTEVGVAYGTQSAGTPLGFLVGYDRDDRKLKWRLRLQPPDSARRMFRPPLVAFHGDHVLVGLIADRTTLLLRLAHLESGRELWHASLAIPGGRQLRGVGLGRTRVFAHVGDRLYAVDAKSGALVKETTPR